MSRCAEALVHLRSHAAKNYLAAIGEWLLCAFSANAMVLSRTGEHGLARKLSGEMGMMPKSLERDAQVESILRMPGSRSKLGAYITHHPAVQLAGMPTTGTGSHSITSAALRFRFAPPTASAGDGGVNAPTIHADHSVGAGHILAPGFRTCISF